MDKKGKGFMNILWYHFYIAFPWTGSSVEKIGIFNWLQDTVEKCKIYESSDDSNVTDFSMLTFSPSLLHYLNYVLVLAGCNLRILSIPSWFLQNFLKEFKSSNPQQNENQYFQGIVQYRNFTPVL